MNKKQENIDPIVFLLKTTKKQHVDDMMKKGRFCFNHPETFSRWEDTNAAQYDRWEAHAAYEATYLVVAPIIGEKENGMPLYGQGRKIADKAILHMQTSVAKNTPICCFRSINQSEVEFVGNGFNYSLGDTANRIKKEFGHDAYVIICWEPFRERLEQCPDYYISGPVVYQDILNDYSFDVGEKNKEIVEQLFRKDKKYEWQKEYRITLSPREKAPVFVEFGSIEDIAVCGAIEELAD